MQPVPFEARPSHPGAGERARLRIEGFAAPIVTTVARRRDDALIVIQALPFLRLNARVRDENDRDARIARVAVDLEQDVPRLVLELTYDDATDGDPPTRGRPLRVDVSLDAIDASWDRRDATLGYGTERPDRPSRIGAALARRDRAIEDTLLFQTEIPSGREDDSVRTTSAWMERSGSELELGARALRARILAAFDIVARAFDQALAALRTDP